MLVLAGAMLIGGCGGSGNDKKAASTNSTKSGSTPAVSGLKTTDIASFCDFQKASGGSSAAAAGSAGSDRADLKKAAGQLDKAADFAPAEIRADMRVFIDGYLKPFYAELSRVDYDFSKINFTAFAGLSRPDVQTASQRIATYYEAHCAK